MAFQYFHSFFIIRFCSRMARKEDEKLTLVSSEFVKSIAEEAEIQIDNEKVTF